MMGAWSGSFSTCILAVVAVADRIGLVHLDATTSLERFLLFAAEVIGGAGAGATVHLVYRPDELNRVMRLTDAMGDGVSDQAHSDLVRWLWRMHDGGKRAAESEWLELIRQHAPSASWSLVPCTRSETSVSVSFVDMPSRTGELWRLQTPCLSRTIATTSLTNLLQLHKDPETLLQQQQQQQLPPQQQRPDPLTAPTTDATLFASSVRLVRHPREYMFAAVSLMEYALRGYFYTVTGQTAVRSSLPALSIFRDGWCAIEEAECIVTGIPPPTGEANSDDRLTGLRDLFLQLDALVASHSCATRLHRVVLAFLAESVHHPGIVTSKDPSHLTRSADAFVFYYLLWKHGPTYRPWLYQVQEFVKEGLSCTPVHATLLSMLNAAIKQDDPAQLLTVRQCSFIREIYCNEEAELFRAQMDNDLRLFRPFVDNQLWLTEQTQTLLAKCAEGNKAFAEAEATSATASSAAGATEQNQGSKVQLKALHTARMAYEETSRFARVSQLLTSPRITKIDGNLAKIREKIRSLLQSHGTVILTPSHPAGAGGIKLTCRVCSSPATTACEACKDGVAYCSTSCREKDRVRHTQNCAGRQSRSDLVTSADESLAMFSAFFQKHPVARIKLDSILTRPQPGTLAIVQEAKPDADPLVVPWTMVESFGFLSPDTVRSTREIVMTACKPHQQTVMLIQANGVSYTNCISVST